MKHNALRYDFTLRELVYFLFKGKKCPKCEGHMTRHKEFESIVGRVFNSHSAAPFHQYANVKHYYWVYRCDNCGASYTLQELVKKS